MHAAPCHIPARTQQKLSRVRFPTLCLALRILLAYAMGQRQAAPAQGGRMLAGRFCTNATLLAAERRQGASCGHMSGGVQSPGCAPSQRRPWLCRCRCIPPCLLR